jgi:hypothetical protein
MDLSVSRMRPFANTRSRLATSHALPPGQG